MGYNLFYFSSQEIYLNVYLIWYLFFFFPLVLLAAFLSISNSVCIYCSALQKFDFINWTDQYLSDYF